MCSSGADPGTCPHSRPQKGLNYGFAPTPYFAGGKPVTPNDSWHLGINRHTKNFAAAAEFVHWMTVGPGNDMWENIIDQVPSLNREVTQIETSPAFAKFPTNVLRLAAYEAERTAIPRPVTPGFNELQDIMTSAFDNIRSGQSPQAALSSAASQIDTALAKYRNAPHHVSGLPAFGRQAIPEEWDVTQGMVGAIRVLAPALVGLVLFRVVPTLYAVGRSFYAISFGLNPATVFVGSDNYTALFNDPTFWQSVRVTALFNVVIDPLQTALALILALLVSMRLRGVGVFRGSSLCRSPC